MQVRGAKVHSWLKGTGLKTHGFGIECARIAGIGRLDRARAWLPEVSKSIGLTSLLSQPAVGFFVWLILGRCLGFAEQLFSFGTEEQVGYLRKNWQWGTGEEWTQLRSEEGGLDGGTGSGWGKCWSR